MNNDKVLADWESKWLDPDYDMATMRYRDIDDEIDEEQLQKEPYSQMPVIDVNISPEEE